MEKLCFLFGHGDAPHSIYPRLQNSINHVYHRDKVFSFLVGNYGNFDSLAREALAVFKRQHPEITVHLLIPYHPAERPIFCPEEFDGTYYPENMENVPHRLAIVKANQYAVNASTHIICFVRHGGNTRNLLEYAERRSKKYPLQILNCASQSDTESK